MKRAAALLVFLLPGLVFAQSGAIPDTVLRSLAKDLADLQSSVADAQRKQQAMATARAPTGGLIADLIRVTNPLAFTKLGAADSAPSLFRPGAGQTYKVIDKTDNWYAVQFPQEYKGFSSGWMKAADVVPEDVKVGLVQAASTQAAATLNEDLYQLLTEKVGRIKVAYQSNPYVSVTGFAVNVGIPPSVTVTFEFKK